MPTKRSIYSCGRAGELKGKGKNRKPDEIRRACALDPFAGLLALSCPQGYVNRGLHFARPATRKYIPNAHHSSTAGVRLAPEHAGSGSVEAESIEYRVADLCRKECILIPGTGPRQLEHMGAIAQIVPLPWQRGIHKKRVRGIKGAV
jgi:hypothetical protein